MVLNPRWGAARPTLGLPARQTPAIVRASGLPFHQGEQRSRWVAVDSPARRRDFAAAGVVGVAP